MNDAEIIKALECCRNGDGVCEDCPSNNKRKNGKDCIDGIIREALALINRQQTEIEKLKKDVIDIDNFARDLCKERILNGNKIATFEDLQSYISKQKSEAVREFAEKLKQKFNGLEYNANTTRKTLAVDVVERQMDWVLHEVTTSEIDNLVNRMYTEKRK